jgi:hypothetical protein
VVVLLADLGIARNLRDLRILEDAGVEPGGRLGLIIEPEARADSLRDCHGLLLSDPWATGAPGHVIDAP